MTDSAAEPPKPENDPPFQEFVETIHRNGNGFSQDDAREAARNLIGFARTALAIRQRILHDAQHDTIPG